MTPPRSPVQVIARLAAVALWLLAYGSTILGLSLLLASVSGLVYPVLWHWLVLATCAAIGIAWIGALVVAWGAHRLRPSGRPSAAWLPMPALVAGCIALIVTGVPGQVCFDLSRPDLEAAAARAQAGQRVDPGRIGLTPVNRIKANPDGTTQFWVDEMGSWLTVCGLAYNPQEIPDVSHELGRDWLFATPIASGWYMFCED
jgi:hypothetical protein